MSRERARNEGHGSLDCLPPPRDFGSARQAKLALWRILSRRMVEAATGSEGAQERDLILAAAQDYGWEDLRPFISSIRSTDFAGDIRIFGAGLSPETIRRLEDAGVAVSQPARVRAKIGDHRFEPLRTPKARILWHLQGAWWYAGRALAYLASDPSNVARRYTAALSNVDVARYFWYLKYLLEEGARYRTVMLSDVRDVVFLGNPFTFEIGDEVCFFLEDDRIPINQQFANTSWIVQAYGPRGLVDLGSYPICCSGVTIGRVSRVVEYLQAMVEQLLRLTRQDRGIDQAVHNYVVRKQLVKNARIISNGDGPVLTVGIMSDDDALELLKSRLSSAKVLHQYTEHPGLSMVVRDQLLHDGSSCEDA